VIDIERVEMTATTATKIALADVTAEKVLSIIAASAVGETKKSIATSLAVSVEERPIFIKRINQILYGLEKSGKIKSASKVGALPIWKGVAAPTTS